MFSLLSEADGHNFTVIANYLIEPGRINATAIRVALIRDATSVTPTIPATTRLKEFPPRGAQQHVQEAASVARAQGRLRSADGAASVFNCRCCDIRQWLKRRRQRTRRLFERCIETACLRCLRPISLSRDRKLCRWSYQGHLSWRPASCPETQPTPGRPFLPRWPPLLF